jgi:hypothetical protein
LLFFFLLVRHQFVRRYVKMLLLFDGACVEKVIAYAEVMKGQEAQNRTIALKTLGSHRGRSRNNNDSFTARLTNMHSFCCHVMRMQCMLRQGHQEKSTGKFQK